MILKFVSLILFLVATLVFCVALPFLLIDSPENWLDYTEHLFKDGSWGFSDSEYPQTVQHFLLICVPQTIFFFLQFFGIFFFLLSLLLFVQRIKKERNSSYSELSRFLGMPKEKVFKQTIAPSLFYTMSFWRFAAPAFFVVVVLAEYVWADNGLGGMARFAVAVADLPLLQGSVFCVGFIFFVLNLLFYAIRLSLPHK